MKKYIKQLVILLSIAVLAIASVTGCGVANAKESKGDEKRVIRLGNFPFSVWNAQIIVAYQNGYFDEVFKDKNVSIEVIDFANGPAANEAFVSGDLDIINGIGDQPIVVGISNGVPTKILSGAAKQGKNIGVISPADRNVNTPADLKGKRVGVFIGTYVHKSIIGILNDAGLTEDDVELVNISSTSDATAAFDSGDIDAYLSMSGDYIHKKVDEEGYKLVVDCEKHPAFSYILASEKFVEENGDILELFFDAIVKAQDFIEKDRDGAYKVIADFSDYDIEVVKNTLDGATIQLSWDADYQQNLFNTYDFLITHEMISNELSESDILSKVDTSIIDKH